MLDPDNVEPERIRPLSRHEYDQLVELGAFGDERVELLRGALVTMSPQGDVHAGLSAWFAQRLIRALDASYDVRSHSPFAADAYSEPEPDVMVSRRESGGHAHPREALLVIEVSDSSIRKDRQVKQAIYAEAGVLEYWIVDVNARVVIVHTLPVGGAYSSIVSIEKTGMLRPVALPGVAIDVAEVGWD